MCVIEEKRSFAKEEKEEETKKKKKIYSLTHSLSFLRRVVSISMVFVNKTLLGGGSVGGKTDAPLFVTWLQCVVTAAACLVAARLTKMALTFLPSLTWGAILKRPLLGRWV